MISSLIALAIARQGEVVFKNASPSVCVVETNTGLGSGFVISPGRIATCWHVIADADAVTVTFPGGQAAEAKVVAADENADLAILATDKTPPPLKARSSRPSPGETLYAIGAPLGLTGSICDGLMSQARTLRGATVYQISNPVNHGNSGGPVLDKSGEVVGMVDFGLVGVNDLNFAVPIQVVLAAPELKVSETIGDFREHNIRDMFVMEFRPTKGDEWVSETRTTISTSQKVIQGLVRSRDQILEADEKGAEVLSTVVKYVSLSPDGTEVPHALPAPKVKKIEPQPGFLPEVAKNMSVAGLSDNTVRLIRLSLIYRPDSLGGCLKVGTTWACTVESPSGARRFPTVQFTGTFAGFETISGIRAAKFIYSAIETGGSAPMAMTQEYWYARGMTELSIRSLTKHVPLAVGITADSSDETTLKEWKLAPAGFHPG